METAVRYEKKYVVPTATETEVIAWLKTQPAHFRRQHPSRQVNSIYFDTWDLQHYHTHVNGASQRYKIRIRWYGNAFGPVADSRLEIKHRVGEVGHKESYPVPPFQLTPSFNQHTVQRLLKAAPVPAARSAELLNVRMVTLISYQRSYWIARHGSLRLTIDSNLTTYLLSNLTNHFLPQPQRTGGVILELKFDRSAAAAAAVVGQALPWRPERFSKYVNAMDALID